jgi:hypothetical protein
MLSGVIGTFFSIIKKISGKIKKSKELVSFSPFISITSQENNLGLLLLVGILIIVFYLKRSELTLLIKTSIKNLIDNKNHIQEICLLVYGILLFLMFSQVETITLEVYVAFWISLFSFFIFLLVKKRVIVFYNKIKEKNPNEVLIFQKFVGLSIAAGLLYFGYYVNILILLILLIGLYFKGTLIEKQDSKFLGQFFRDQVTVENHLKNEFKSFEYLESYTFFIFLILGLSCTHFKNVFITFLEFDQACLLLSFFSTIIFFNVIILTLIKGIIIFYCNPNTGLKIAQFCATCFVGGGISFGVYSMQVYMTPCLPREIVDPLQMSANGFKHKRASEYLLGDLHESLNLGTPPLKSNGYIDTDKTSEAVFAKTGTNLGNALISSIWKGKE